MNTTAPDNIVRRIQGLLNLAANNPSEAEATAAAEKASALLAEYNLTAAAMPDANPTSVDNTLGHTKATTKAGTPWIRYLWQAVAQLNFCDYCYSSGNHRTYHSVIGTPVNVQVTIQMATYLTDAIRALAKRSAKTGNYDAKWQHGFNCGCGDRVSSRVRERLADLKANRTPKTATVNSSLSANLPALYESNDRQLSAYMRDVMHTRKTSQRRTTSTDYYGRQAGRAAGNSIGLDTQVGSSATSHARLS